MGKHRSRLNILAKILSVVSTNNGAKKTQIMYQAYLSYKLLVQYLNDLTKAGLVVCGEENYYKLTTKGEDFLTKLGEYVNLRKNVDEQVSNMEGQRLMLEKLCPSIDEVKFNSRNLKRNRA